MAKVERRGAFHISNVREKGRFIVGGPEMKERGDKTEKKEDRYGFEWARSSGGSELVLDIREG